MTHDGDRVGTVVAGVSLAPYDETATIALVGSLGLAVLLLAAVALLSHWILGKALLPVSRMTDDAADWSDHDLDRRFNRGEPYDELTQLAATLDALLERLSASLRHEQRFTAELSHELRTPLARIAAESELALRRERTGEDYRASLEAVQRNAEQMTRTVEALVAAARQEAGLSRATSDARDGVRAAVEAVHDEAETAGIETRARPARSSGAGGDRARAARADRAAAARQRASLRPLARVGRAERQRHLRGRRRSATTAPAWRRTRRERIFEPGVRGSAAADEPRGAGLGLALARRLARTAGGEISAEADGDGARFRVTLPLA